VDAPGTGTTNQNVQVTVTDSATGAPVAGATITVTSPTGEQFVIVTDADGMASFIPTEPGLYTYSVDGYRESMPTSTNVQRPGTTPVRTPTPAATPTPSPSATPAQGGGDVFLVGATAAGFIVIAVIVIGGVAYYLYSRRRRRGL
jgi:hypothetical protein